MTDLTSAAVPPIGPEDHLRGEGEEGLIVYADLGCPHCAAAWAEIAARPGRIAFRHFPVASKHPRSPALHAAAEAAGAREGSSRWSTRSMPTAATSTTRTSGSGRSASGSTSSASSATVARPISPPVCAATSNPAFAPGSRALRRYSMHVPLSQLENESSEEKRMAANRAAGGRTTK